MIDPDYNVSKLSLPFLRIRFDTRMTLSLRLFNLILSSNGGREE
jgi:hypothetical protein